MARHRHARLPKFLEQMFQARQGRRDVPQRLEDLEKYLPQLVTALEEVLRDSANTSNVNANSALLVNEGESLPTVSEDLMGRILIQRITATQSRYWYVADDAAGAPTYFELTPGGGGGGDSILVNGVAVTNANFNDTTPAAVGTGRNVFFQRSGSGPDAVSAYMNLFTALLAGIVPASGGGTTNFLRADATWAAPTAAVAATAVTITAPYGSRDYLETVVDVACGAGSKPLLLPGIYAQTDTNTPEDVQAHVESVAVGSFTVRMLAQERQTFGGPFKFNYLLG